jgi:processive 1,2-diacylglycerol beta-glucosyltransferase
VNVLRDKETGATLGNISEQQLQFLIDQLEEESANDTDYYINKASLEMFAEQGGDPQLLELLQRALGDREAMEIEWSTL